MGIHVRQADLDADRQTIIDILNENLPVLEHERRFDWLHHNNPHGQSQTWIAADSKTGSSIGTASVFPRLVGIGNETMLCGQVGDFAIRWKEWKLIIKIHKPVSLGKMLSAVF